MSEHTAENDALTEVLRVALTGPMPGRHRPAWAETLARAVLASPGLEVRVIPHPGRRPRGGTMSEHTAEKVALTCPRCEHPNLDHYRGFCHHRAGVAVCGCRVPPGECGDYPAPCNHDPAHVIPPDEETPAEVWEDGYDAGHGDARAVQPTYPDPTPNPYKASGFSQ